MTKRPSSKPASIGLLLAVASALMALASLVYATHRHVVEYPMEWYEGDDGWETEWEWYGVRQVALDHRGLP